MYLSQTNLWIEIRECWKDTYQVLEDALQVLLGLDYDSSVDDEVVLLRTCENGDERIILVVASSSRSRVIRYYKLIVHCVTYNTIVLYYCTSFYILRILSLHHSTALIFAYVRESNRESKSYFSRTRASEILSLPSSRENDAAVSVQGTILNSFFTSG